MQLSEGLSRSEGSASATAHIDGWGAGAGCWWEASVSLPVDLSSRPECPHGIMSGFLQSKWSEKNQEGSNNTFYDSVSEDTCCHFCNILLLQTEMLTLSHILGKKDWGPTFGKKEYQRVFGCTTKPRESTFFLLIINLPPTCKIYSPSQAPPRYHSSWRIWASKSNAAVNEALQMWFLEYNSSLSEDLSTARTRDLCHTPIYNGEKSLGCRTQCNHSLL